MSDRSDFDWELTPYRHVDCDAFVWCSRMWAVDEAGPYFRISFIDPFGFGLRTLDKCPVCGDPVSSWVDEKGQVDMSALMYLDAADRRRFEAVMAESCRELLPMEKEEQLSLPSLPATIPFDVAADVRRILELMEENFG